MSGEKLVLRLTVTCHKGGTWEVAANRADGSTARHRGMAEYDNAFFAVEDELDALHDSFLAAAGVVSPAPPTKTGEA